MIQNLINKYAEDPFDFEVNLNLAMEYEKIGQLASSVSHFLKAADLAKTDRAKMYLAISGTARNFIKAGGREATVEGLLKRAVSLAPKISEPYVVLSNFYEAKKQWYDCYMVASLGWANCLDKDFRLYFNKGVAAWWIGNIQESKEIIYCLWKQKHKLPKEYADLVDRNLQGVGDPYGYTKHRKEWLAITKRPFPGIEKIKENYAQCSQDLFALLVARGKENGFYLEVGSGDPEHNNNTCTLERDFNWSGISIDCDFNVTQRFKALRSNTCLMADALQIDYNEILKQYNAPEVIDYLQIDIDPPQDLSLGVLYKIPFNEYKFRAITFEHNGWEHPHIRDISRDYLEKRNYKLVVSDVCFREDKAFEDWWVHASVPFASPNIDLTTGPKTDKRYFYDFEEFEKLHLTAISNWATL